MTLRLDLSYAFVCDSKSQALALDEAIGLAVERAVADHGVRIKVGVTFGLRSCQGDDCLGMVLCADEEESPAAKNGGERGGSHRA